MTDIASAYVRLRPNSAGFKQEAERQISGSLSGLKKTVGAAIGGLGVYEVLKSTFEAAAHEQSAVASIQLAVKNAGAQWVIYGKTVKEILDEQEHAKGFDFPEEAQAFGRLLQQTKDTKVALTDLNIAMDVSRARHLQLAQVATALSRLEGGNAQSLSRLGIITDKYTGAQDALKAQIRDVTVALSAQAAAHQKTYDGQTQVTQSQAQLLTLSKSQLKAREDDLKAQLAQAAAADKQVTVENARAEVIRRYGGQADAFAKTAAGQLAILHTSIEQVQEDIGTAFLPLLTQGGKALSEWAYQLSESDSFQRQLATGARDLGQALHTVGDGVHAVEPLLEALQSIVDVTGVGPAALGFLGVWKLAPAVLAKAGASTVALSADTQALQASLAAAGTQLDALSTQIATLGTTETAVTAETEGLTAAQLELIAAIDANIAATETLLTVESEQSVAAAKMGISMAGMLGPLALLGGALYYVHERFDKADHAAQDFSDTVGKLQDAVKLAGTDVAGAAITRDQASAQLDAARQRHDAAVLALRGDSDASVGAERLASDQAALRDTTLTLRAATHAYTQSLDDLKQKQTDQAKGIAAQKAQLGSLVGQVVALGVKSNQVAGFLASHGKDSWLQNLPQHSLDLFLQALDELGKKNPSMQHAIDNLKGVAEAAHKIPDKVTIALILDPSMDAQALTDAITGQINAATSAAQNALAHLNQPTAFLTRGGLAPQPTKTGADFAKDFLKAGGRYPAEVKVKVKPTGKDAAVAYSTEFVQTLDAADIGKALAASIASAQQQMTQAGGALASSLGGVLDARLALVEKGIDAADVRIQAKIHARQVAATARSTQSASDDAALKLKELQAVLGTGALTADQQQQLQQAKNAVLDAQDSVANASDQAQLDAHASRKALLEQQSTLEKTAGAQRIADLTDELNRGLITQAKYVKAVRALLAKEGVTYKQTGALLGKSFADGFSDQLHDVVAQARALGGVGKEALRKAPRGTAAISPVADEAKAIQAFIDQIAGSGGRFKIKNAGSLPAGVDLGQLISAANAQRSESAYREKTSKQTATGIQYAGETRDHTAAILAELKKQRHVTVNVTVDDASKKRKIAQATQ